jgi:hypothetical protein
VIRQPPEKKLMRIDRTAHSRLALMLAASIACAGSLGAQGLSYDMSTIGSVPDRTGNLTTRNFMVGHGQFAGGNSRIDVSESLAPGGVMSAGKYMITSSSKGTVTSVDPAKHQYTVIDVAELGKTATDLQAAMGGIAKTEIADAKVSMEDLGPGEPLDGYATYKYRLTESFTMNMTIMGHTISTPSASSTDIWLAPQLDGVMDPSARPPTSVSTGPMAELTRQTITAYSKMRKGLMLKRVTTSDQGTGDHKRTTTITTTITNVKKSPISASVFEVPAGYAKVGIMDAIATPAEAAQSHKP